MRKREIQPELMDDPSIAYEDHLEALKGLARLNRLTQVARPLYNRIHAWAKSSSRPLRVLDVATGSGDIPLQWARWAIKDRISLDLFATDISPQAIQIASDKGHQQNASVRWFTSNILENHLPSDFDVVTCSLFMHHLSDDEIIIALRVMRDAVGGGHRPGRILICDLARSNFNQTLVWIGSRLVTRSKIVHTDATLSIRAALTPEEFSDLVFVAFERVPRIQRLFPCRFIAEIADL